MRLWRRITIGSAVTVLFVVIAMVIDGTDAIVHLQMQAYGFLSKALPDFSETPLPLILDIGKLGGGTEDCPTPRDSLEKLLTAISDNGPWAIAVDVDFSPNESGWITRGDPDFFRFCLDKSKSPKPPIFLGVNRTRRAQPDQWLGIAEYTPLAGGGSASHGDPRVPVQFESPDPRHPLPTLAQRLAEQYHGKQPKRSWLIAKMTEPQKDDGDHTILVNYSKLRQLRSEARTVTNINSVTDLSRDLHDRLVILGHVYQASDTFIVPGQDAPVPGAYIVASAAYTLAIAPLYEFTKGIRLFLDITLSAVVIVSFFGISVKAPDERVQKLENRFLWGIVLGVVSMGILLVRYASIMWLDFFWVVFVLLLHRRVEKWLAAAFTWRRRGATS